MIKIRTRFAPSPTGRLHMGNVRTALLCWHHARKNGGSFLLRIDDTDATRSEEVLIKHIVDDMAWLGLDYDGYFQQSHRKARYDEVSEQLRKSGFLYPCYETKEELDTARKVLLKRGLPPIYRRGVGLGIKTSDGRSPHWRFDMTLGKDKIAWDDLIKGRIEFSVANLSDPIVIRDDGSYPYMLPSVIDDNDYDISSVTRGDDHITNTAVQIAIAESLGAVAPVFSHVPLLQDKLNKLSKRTGSIGIDYMRTLGVSVEAIYSYLLSLGSANPQLFSANTKDHLASFDLTNYSKGACIFSMEDLLKTNKYMLQNLSMQKIKEEFSLTHIDEKIWLAVRNNIESMEEFYLWQKRFKGEFDRPIFSDVELELLNTALATFSTTSWDALAVKRALDELSVKFGKAKSMSTVRKALMGLATGPDVLNILLAMDRDYVISTISRFVEGADNAD